MFYGNDMSDRFTELETRIRRLEEHVAKLEGAAPPVTAAVAHRDAAEVTASTQNSGSEIDIALAGKSLIGMGGAYFLRAITESQLIPKPAGIALGLAYAALWIYLGWRNAERRQRHAATFAMIVAALVAYPLIWEATAHFNAFNASAATIVALATSAALIWIAFKYDLSTGAWIASFGLIGCTAGVALATERMSIPFIGLTIAGAVLWELARRRQWELAAWPIAIVSAIAGMPLILLAAGNHIKDPDGLAAFALILLALAYLGVIGVRVDLGAIAQSALVVIIGFGGAIRIAQDKQVLEFAVVMTIMAVGVIAYYGAFRATARLPKYYLSILGITSFLMATAAVTTPVVAGILWSVLALLTVLVAQMLKSTELALHTMLYPLASAGAGGLLTGSLSTISGVGSQAPLTYARMMTATLLITATVLAFLATEGHARRHARIARMVMLTISLLITIAGVALIAVHLTSNDAGIAAAIRSAIIAIAAVSLAFASRTQTFADASYLVYPLLGLGAAKFVVDDFLRGRAATLFVTLAVYGCALLMLARMRSRAPATA